MDAKKRLYEDYLKPSRLPLYRSILEKAKQNNYEMMSELTFYNLLVTGGIKGRKILINRHDIDTSPKVAAKMFEIEKAIYGKNGSATYYFRLSTIDKSLIHMIDSYGYESGYHYEELATIEKKVKSKKVDDLLKLIPDAQQLFLKNILYFRNITGSPSISVASHGDFINTMYHIQNTSLLKSEKIRQKAGVLFEAYDEIVNNPVQKRFADQVLLERFASQVISAIDENASIIMLLTHPRNWEVDFWANTKDNIMRVVQGLLYKV